MVREISDESLNVSERNLTKINLFGEHKKKLTSYRVDEKVSFVIYGLTNLCPPMNSAMLSSASTLVFLPLVGLRTYLHYAINTAQLIKKILNFFIKKLTPLFVTDLLSVFQMNLIIKIMHNFCFLKNLYGITYILV